MGTLTLRRPVSPEVLRRWRLQNQHCASEHQSFLASYRTLPAGSRHGRQMDLQTNIEHIADSNLDATNMNTVDNTGSFILTARLSWKAWLVCTL